MLVVATPSTEVGHKEPKVYTVPKKTNDGACNMRDGASRIYFTLNEGNKKAKQERNEGNG